MEPYTKVFLAGTITGQITVRTSPDIAMFKMNSFRARQGN